MVHEEYNKTGFLYRANTKGKTKKSKIIYCTQCLDVH